MQSQKLCPGVTEVRQITHEMYGIRVSRRLIPRLKKVPELQRANTRSDLFCLKLTNPLEKSTDGALKRFREIVAKAGLGRHYAYDSWCVNSVRSVGLSGYGRK